MVKFVREFGSGSCMWETRAENLGLLEPKVEPVSPLNEHLARDQGEGSFTPKLLIISTFLSQLARIS